MKKWMSVFFSSALALALLAGCGGEELDGIGDNDGDTPGFSNGGDQTPGTNDPGPGNGGDNGGQVPLVPDDNQTPDTDTPDPDTQAPADDEDASSDDEAGGDMAPGAEEPQTDGDGDTAQGEQPGDATILPAQ